jgi:hypothetical protein
MKLHLPKLNADQIGVYNNPGWFLQESGRSTGGQQVIFQCPFTDLGALTDHDIAPDGIVHPSVWCCDKFHEWVILDGWDPAWRHDPGQLVIRKLI